MTVGVTVNMYCRITATSATYYVNDQKFATATYSEGDLPARGYFCFAVGGDFSLRIV